MAWAGTLTLRSNAILYAVLVGASRCERLTRCCWEPPQSRGKSFIEVAVETGVRGWGSKRVPCVVSRVAWRGAGRMTPSISLCCALPRILLSLALA